MSPTVHINGELACQNGNYLDRLPGQVTHVYAPDPWPLTSQGTVIRDVYYTALQSIHEHFFPWECQGVCPSGRQVRQFKCKFALRGCGHWSWGLFLFYQVSLSKFGLNRTAEYAAGCAISCSREDRPATGQYTHVDHYGCIPFEMSYAFAACAVINSIYESNVPGVGAYGGSCTCPDGRVYQVGDNNDMCQSLACIGGVPGKCNAHDGVWSHNQVTCGTSLSGDDTTVPPCTEQPTSPEQPAGFCDLYPVPFTPYHVLCTLHPVLCTPVPCTLYCVPRTVDLVQRA